MENVKIVEIASKLKESKKIFDDTNKEIYDSYGVVFKGFISFDQSGDMESYDLENVVVGDFITVSHSGEDSHTAVVIEIDEDEPEYAEWVSIHSVEV